MSRFDTLGEHRDAVVACAGLTKRSSGRDQPGPTALISTSWMLEAVASRGAGVWPTQVKGLSGLASALRVWVADDSPDLHARWRPSTAICENRTAGH